MLCSRSGVQDRLIAVVDGLKGLPDAITAAFPDAAVQTCIVHLKRVVSNLNHLTRLEIKNFNALSDST